MQLSVPSLLAVCTTVAGVAAEYQPTLSQQDPDEVLQCNVKQIHGMVRPGQIRLPTKYICHDVEHPSYTYSLSGDVGSFFEGENMASGSVQINVPYSAIDSGRNIPIDDHAASPITISYDRRRLSSVSSTGKKKVLIVRVSDDENGSNGERKVDQDESQLYLDFFRDANSLKKVYKRCSGNRLNFVPATGDRVNRGVITVDPPEIVCGTHYKMASDYARDQLADLNLDTKHIMFIMPACLDWEGALAWGVMNGYLTWISTTYASFPMFQIHEMGHNLGLGHSGDGDDVYGDDTCYMGDRVQWDDIGAKMCFNAAKLWYLGWYSKYHGSYKPEKYGVSVRLIGIGEAQAKDRFIGSEKVVIRLVSTNRKTKPLLLKYNHRQGPNEGVVGDWNRVVIIQQNKKHTDSWKKKSLAPGGVCYRRNWDKQGNTLVVKHCGFTQGSWGNSPTLASANIIVYVEGRSSKNCSVFGNALVSNAINAFNDYSPGTSSQVSSNLGIAHHRDSSHGALDAVSGPGSCTDIPGFSDAYGSDYNCAWYEQAEYLCTSTGSDVPNAEGITAADACCVCGGGKYSNEPYPDTNVSSSANADAVNWYTDWSITP